MEFLIYILVAVVLPLLVVAFVVVTVLNILRQRKARPADGKQTILCPACRQKLRVPQNKGKLMVRCPRCGKEFLHNSGSTPPAAPKAPAPSFRAPRPATSSGQSAPAGDELDRYRPGGSLRKELNLHPTQAREALLNLLAAWAAAFVRVHLYDRTSTLWELAHKHGGSIESVRLDWGADQVQIMVRFVHAPAPEYPLQYTYNEAAKKEGEAPIVLTSREADWVRDAALSRLADTVPEARMQKGCLLP